MGGIIGASRNSRRELATKRMREPNRADPPITKKEDLQMEFLNHEKRPDTADIQYVIDGFAAGTIKDGDKVQLKGTIHRIKEMSGFAFVNIRSARLVFQCVWEDGKSAVSAEQFKDFSCEECVIIDGTVIAEERSRLGFDIRIDDMKRISGKAAVLPIEISNDRKIDKLNLNTLSLSKLRQHPYVDFYMARAINDYRRLKGPLKSLDDLRLLPEFPPEVLERLRPDVTF